MSLHAGVTSGARVFKRPTEEFVRVQGVEVGASE